MEHNEELDMLNLSGLPEWSLSVLDEFYSGKDLESLPPRSPNEATLEALVADRITPILNLDMTHFDANVAFIKNLIKRKPSLPPNIRPVIKHIIPYFESLKQTLGKLENQVPPQRQALADIIALIAMCVEQFTDEKSLQCLKYHLLGTRDVESSWGPHYEEYLKGQIATICNRKYGNKVHLTDLISSYVIRDFNRGRERVACDFLIDTLHVKLVICLISNSNYGSITSYLEGRAPFENKFKQLNIHEALVTIHINHENFSKAFMSALFTRDQKQINSIFNTCTDLANLFQFAFMCGRHFLNVELQLGPTLQKNIMEVVNNQNFSTLFLQFAKTLNIQPVNIEDIFMLFHQNHVVMSNIDPIYNELTQIFSIAFVNAAFCTNKILSESEIAQYIERYPGSLLVSYVASWGLAYMWSPEHGFNSIKPLLNSDNDRIKSGTFIGIGLMYSRLRTADSSLFTLMSAHFNNTNPLVQQTCAFGLGLSFLATGREDVTAALRELILNTTIPECFAIGCLGIGLVNFSMNRREITALIQMRMFSWTSPKSKSPYLMLAMLGLGFTFFGQKKNVDALGATYGGLDKKYQCILKACAYAGSGDMSLFEDLLALVGNYEKSKKTANKKLKSSLADAYMLQAVAILTIACISLGDNACTEKCHKLLTDVGMNGHPITCRAVPIAIALHAVSRANSNVVNELIKYSRDTDEHVSICGLFGLALVGAGTNGSRVAEALGHMSYFHQQSGPALFIVRLAQSMSYMGRGVLGLRPLRYDTEMLDYIALAGILIPVMCMLRGRKFLREASYLFFALSLAIQPNWLLTLDTSLNQIRVPVSVDNVTDTAQPSTSNQPSTSKQPSTSNQPSTSKQPSTSNQPSTSKQPSTSSQPTGSSIQVTPITLHHYQCAKLATDVYQSVAPLMQGICVLKKVGQSTAPK